MKKLKVGLSVLLGLFMALTLIGTLELLSPLLPDFHQASFKPYKYTGIQKMALKSDLPLRDKTKKHINVPDPSRSSTVAASPGLLEYHKKTGLAKYPHSQSIKATKLGDQGELIFDVTYSFDESGRRETIRPLNTEYKSHLIVSGCSFVFGEGLNDSETLSSQLQKRIPQSKVYNLGIQGGSIATTLAAIQFFETWDNIQPSQGTLLVGLYPALHIPRFLNSMRNTGSWADRSPVFEKSDSTKHFEFKGLFEDVHPLRKKIYRWLAKSALLEKMHVDWPPLNDDHFIVYAEAIKDLEILYKKKFGDKNGFVVYFYPGDSSSTYMIPHLERLEIPYLDYSPLKLKYFIPGKDKIPKDGHPSAQYNRFLAAQISRDLKISENKKFLSK